MKTQQNGEPWHWGSDNATVFAAGEITAGCEKDYVATGTILSGSVGTAMQFRLDNITGTVTVSNMKLELGTEATEWLPAISE